MNRFWEWKRQKCLNKETNEETIERTLLLNGTIAEESWFDDDITPALFREELNGGKGDITVWINSPGGDCFAAAQIYNMLRDYKGKVTVKVDGIAASAASVIAMAGDTVLVSPVSMIMIHNPATVAMGDHTEMQKAIEMLEEVKNSIINAYVSKTGLSRGKLSRLMDEETWMDANKAVELHFADAVIERDALSDKKPKEDEPDEEPDTEEAGENAPGEEEEEKKKKSSMLFSRRSVAAAMNKKLIDYCEKNTQPEEPAQDTSRKAEDLYKRLDLMKKFI